MSEKELPADVRYGINYALGQIAQTALVKFSGKPCDCTYGVSYGKAFPILTDLVRPLVEEIERLRNVPNEMCSITSIAQHFHEEYERLAPDFGYFTKKSSQVPYKQLPDNHKGLMESVVFTVIGPMYRKIDLLNRKIADLRSRLDRAEKALGEIADIGWPKIHRADCAGDFDYEIKWGRAVDSLLSQCQGIAKQSLARQGLEGGGR